MKTPRRSLTVLALGAVLAIAWAPRAGARSHEGHEAQLERAGFRAKVDPFPIGRQYVIRAER